MKRTLIAGIGKLHGDESFGRAVARQLAKATLPEGVAVMDFGTHGHDLAYAITGGYETVILVDASACGGKPGTLYVMELDPELGCTGGNNGHSVDLGVVLRLVRSSQATVGRLYLVGCEPGSHGEEEEDTDLSPQVATAIPQAIETIHLLLNELTDAEAGLHAEHRTPSPLAEPVGC